MAAFGINILSAGYEIAQAGPAGNNINDGHQPTVFMSREPPTGAVYSRPN
eukprot:CAMPEP_0172856170 /NCGR_PEP_ID=MMETSP1075-20121228/63894_1 /TAXON_ID=2916 /ORGANISM="Ceratium fusus, Strain PA161109" /LENGTH=49 /DNA_ID= /DNA_START= /DNA_END= /DNA_ORIENTATION=